MPSVTSSECEERKISMDHNKLKEFEPIFYPQSIAVVGVSKNGTKIGNAYLRTLIDAGFKGQIYAVNPTGEKIAGARTFRSIDTIPGPVDYVIVSIPKRHILSLLDECRNKGVKVVQIFSAGFSESGEEEDKELEMELLRKAKSAGIRIIGPNCIGVYNSSKRMGLLKGLPPEAWETGDVSFIGQSGGNTIFFVEMGLMQGIRFNNVISFGNGNDLTSLDLFEYFGMDPGTRIISAYLEGIKDGHQFIELLQELTRTKPIVIWKGGTTEAGARTAASHTASLAGSDTIWRGAFKQSGVIKAETLEELVDTTLGLQFLPRFQGNRVAAICGFAGAGGGASVAAGDACIRKGLDVVSLTDETTRQLRALLSYEGCIAHNPIDVNGLVMRDMEVLEKTIQVVFEDTRVDIVIAHVPVSVLLGFSTDILLNKVTDMLVHIRKRQSKPFIIVTQMGASEDKRLIFEDTCTKAHIPIYPTFERAAEVVANIHQYWQYRSEIGC